MIRITRPYNCCDLRSIPSSPDISWENGPTFFGSRLVGSSRFGSYSATTEREIGIPEFVGSSSWIGNDGIEEIARNRRKYSTTCTRARSKENISLSILDTIDRNEISENAIVSEYTIGSHELKGFELGSTDRHRSTVIPSLGVRLYTDKIGEIDNFLLTTCDVPHLDGRNITRIVERGTQ